MFKFHITTILLTVALIATLLSWYVDHSSRRTITGSWNVSFVGPVTELLDTNTLEIRTDYTFTKVEDYGNEIKTISGEYDVVADGLFQFHAKKLTISTRDGQSQTSNLDYIYCCHCGVASSGCLMVLEQSIPSRPDDLTEIEWTNLYTRETAR